MKEPVESRGFDPIAFVKNVMRNSPWIVMAVALHVILVAIAAVSYMHKAEQAKPDVVTAIAISGPQEVIEEEIIQPPEPIDRRAIPKNEEAELVSFEEDVYIPTTDTVEDLTLDRGDPSAMDNLPTGGTTGGTAIGVGAGGHHGSGKPSPFGGRKLGTTGKGRGGGATQGTDKAVLDGLRWLVRHQNPDGSWGAASLAERCMPDKPCFEDKFKYSDHYDEGLTAMALLCFLGAGFSHESKQDIVDTTMAKRHKIGEVVKNGLQWLVKKQNQDGSFSKDRAFMYNEALCALALAEAYGLTQNRYWKEPAQRSIDFLQKAQKPNPSGKGLWGWRYASRVEIEDFRRSGSQDDAYLKELYDADTSVTGWVVMALKSAQISGLTVSKESMEGAMEFCKWVTPEGGNGLVGYLDAKGAGAPLTGPNDAGFLYHPTSMSALGMCIRIFTQHDPADPFLEQAAQRIIKDLPQLHTDKSKQSPVDYYYWYYASLALNQLDGPDSPKKSGKYWGPWNKAMVDCVTGLQDHTERVCRNGGWVDGDRWNYAGGPVYTTAINTLTLEVYYRYENAFGGAKRN
jgi:hypothetical protein